MKKIIAVAAVLSVAACAQPEAEEEMTEEAVVEEVAAGPMDGVGGPGTYEVTYSDGSVGTFTAAEDGTYSATVGDDAGTGTITEQDGKTCFDADGDDAGAVCWTNSEVGEDGSWTSTSDEGDVVTVRPAAAE